MKVQNRKSHLVEKLILVRRNVELGGETIKLKRNEWSEYSRYMYSWIFKAIGDSVFGFVYFYFGKAVNLDDSL